MILVKYLNDRTKSKLEGKKCSVTKNNTEKPNERTRSYGMHINCYKIHTSKIFFAEKM